MTTVERAPALIDQREVNRALSILADPGQVIELRALNATTSTDTRYKNDIMSGYFDSHTKLIQELATIRAAMGFYITLQACQPDLINRSYNHIKKAGKDSTTPDKYILNYRWLLIDSDPERVSGISSTDKEHETALSKSRFIREELTALQWPDPVVADSGNGSHLLYRVNLSIEDETLVKRVLEGLSTLYSTPEIKVDQTVFNPARICKLYGTRACKGDNTPERPHRMSKILEAPETIQIVPRELLEAIAAPVASKPAPVVRTAYSPAPSQFDLTSWIQTHGIDTYGEESYQGGRKWILKNCPFCQSEDRAAILTLNLNGAIGFRCQHDRCTGRKWQDFRTYYEPDAYDRKTAPIKKQAPTTEELPDGDKEESAQVKLMRFVEEAKFIYSPSGKLYARIPVKGHIETASINEKGSGFRRWLVYRFHSTYGFAPNSEALSQTMQSVQAIAEYEGERAKVHTRIAEYNGCVYLDLGSDSWECIQIAPDGWRVIPNPPVYFRRPGGLLPLPIPVKGGNIGDLRQLINAKDDKDYMLITAWLVGTLHPRGPYPVLSLNGQRGSAKSKTTTMLRNLIDPNTAPLRNAPRDDRDAAIAAQNSMIIALDNLSSLPFWLSDTLCKIATGSGFATRGLYTDDDEIVLQSTRPIIMNGIEDGLITQGDLLSRSMLVSLEPPTDYLSEEEIDQRFKDLHPRLLGALLTIASCALKNRKSVRLESPPRMADFARWIAASEPALKWEPGAFMAIYTENQDNSSTIVTESSPIAKAIVQFMENNPLGWSGLTSQLLTELEKYEVFKEAKYAPKTATKLSGQLKRIAPALRSQDIDIQQPPRSKEGSKVIIAGVGKTLAGVGKIPSGVGKTLAGVGKTNLPTPIAIPEIEPVQTSFSEKGVAGVGKMHDSSGIYPPVWSKKIEKREGNIEIPDRAGILPTLATLATPFSDMEIETVTL